MQVKNDPRCLRQINNEMSNKIPHHELKGNQKLLPHFQSFNVSEHNGDKQYLTNVLRTYRILFGAQMVFHGF